MTNKLGLHDLDVNGKRVLVRVDFNVPMDGKKSPIIHVSAQLFRQF